MNPSAATPRPYIAYYRLSREKKGRRGSDSSIEDNRPETLGIQAQMEAVANLVKREGGELISEYREIESGKSHKNRPELNAALAECKKKKAILVIAKLDRLARNVHFISGLMEAGVEFRACDNPNATKLTLHILAAVAEHERETISGRIKDALRQKKKELETEGEGKKLGNPQWENALEKAHEKTRAPTPADDILELIKLRRAGKHKEGEIWTVRKPVAYSEIAEELNGLKVQTMHGKAWHASTVRKIWLRIVDEMNEPYERTVDEEEEEKEGKE
jgi:DNA invertase Pin-like site-specific DNA recombinase